MKEYFRYFRWVFAATVVLAVCYGGDWPVPCHAGDTGEDEQGMPDGAEGF